MKLAMNGPWTNLESTITGGIGLAASVGVFNAAQAAGLSSTVQAVATLVCLVLSTLKLFQAPPADPTNNTNP